jgi:hypothetical protein
VCQAHELDAHQKLLSAEGLQVSRKSFYEGRERHNDKEKERSGERGQRDRASVSMMSQTSINTQEDSTICPLSSPGNPDIVCR